MSDRRTKAIGFGIVVIAVGLLFVWRGLAALSQPRDADGYFVSAPLRIERASRAVMTNDVGLLRGHCDCAAEETLILNLYSPDDVRMRGVASEPGALFIGIGPADAVAGYLDGVTHDEITGWDCDVDHITSVEYARHEGSAAPGAPGTEPFWVRSVSGSGEQTLDWTIESGEWTVVMVNTDVSSGLSADVRFGASAPSNLDVLAWGSFTVGLVALLGGGWLLYLAVRLGGRNRTSVGREVMVEEQ